MIAFLKKEWMAMVRTGKVLILGMLFLAFGIMNPAVAKLTPWLLETMGESLASSGLVVTQVQITALDSWVQFYKNIPMALIVFVILLSGIATEEYRAGTLILALTKGLSRSKILLSKAIMLMVLWTAGYWLCAGVTYGYTAYYWDQSVVQNMLFSLMAWWVLGVWTVALMVLFSAAANASGGVMLLTGGSFLACYLASLLPKVGEWMPTNLMGATALIYGLAEPAELTKALVVAGIMIPLCVALAMPILHKKQL